MALISATVRATRVTLRLSLAQLEAAGLDQLRPAVTGTTLGQSVFDVATHAPADENLSDSQVSHRAAPAPVDLTVRGRLLEGTVHGAPIRVDLGQRSHDMAVIGTFARETVEARVSYEDNSVSPVGLTARLVGTFGGRPPTCISSTTWRPRTCSTAVRSPATWTVQTLTSRPQGLRGRLPAPWPCREPGATNRINLSASVFGNLQGGFVRGTIGDTAVSVSAERRDSPQGSVGVTGTWEGSSGALLTLAVSAMANFM